MHLRAIIKYTKKQKLNGNFCTLNPSIIKPSRNRDLIDNKCIYAIDAHYDSPKTLTDDNNVVKGKTKVFAASIRKVVSYNNNALNIL